MYVFDTSSLSALFNFYPTIFTSLWDRFNDAVKQGNIISVLESWNELQDRNKDVSINEWLKTNKNIFLPPDSEEAIFITTSLFTVKNGHFQSLVEKAKRLKGGICADPFIIAKAKIMGYSVVTEEGSKRGIQPNGAKIPNACEFFDIKCIRLEQFMQLEKWSF